MLSNLEIVAMATEDGPCLDAILDAKGSDHCLLLRSRLFSLEERRCWIALPFLPCSQTQPIEATFVRGPLTGHFSGRVLRGMFA